MRGASDGNDGSRGETAWHERTAIEVDHAAEEEAVRLLRWRFRQLSRAGCSPGQAVVLACSLGVDLHEAVDLLERGCPPETAIRILL